MSNGIGATPREVDRAADTDPYRDLVRTAYRSRAIDADHEPPGFPPDT